MAGSLNLDNFRRREWAPAIEASGVRKPARIYDLRSTFAVGRARRQRVASFSWPGSWAHRVRMIERHYGALLDGAGAEIAGRLDALDAQQERDDEARSEDG